MSHMTSGVERVLDVWSRRKWLVLGGLATLVVPLVSVVLSLPDLYRSSATVLVERRQMPDLVVRPSVVGELETRLQTISEKMLSRGRLGDLVARFDLYPHLRQGASLDLAIERMRRDVRVEFKAVDHEGGRATLAFTVSYQGTDPTTTAEVTNALASFHIEENARVRERIATGAVAYLKAELDQTAGRLAEEEDRVAAFKKRHGVELPQQIVVNLTMLERLNTHLRFTTEALARATERRALLTRPATNGRPPAPVSAPVRPAPPPPPPPPAPDSPAGRLARLKVELSDLSRQYTDRYPEVIRLKAQVAALEEEVAAAAASERQKTASAAVAAAPPPPVPVASEPAEAPEQRQEGIALVDSEIAALKAEESRLRHEIDTYRVRLENTPQREQGLQEVSRVYDATKELYVSLLKRYEEATLAESMEQQQRGDEVRILDPATPAAGPSAPNRLRLLILGGALAVALTVAVTTVIEHVDDVFHSAGELRAATPLPVVGRVPRIVTRADTSRRRRRLLAAAVTIVVALTVLAAVTHRIATGNYALVAMLSRSS